MGTASLDPISGKAIDAALNNNWREALELNRELLTRYPDDVETLNRLARAYFELGSVPKAKEVYKSVLELDPYNPIATKNIKKLSDIKSADLKHNVASNSQNNTQTPRDSFLEEPGVTKIIKVQGYPNLKTLAQLQTADTLEIKTKYNNALVYTKDNHKIGTIDPVWGKRIAKAIRIGSVFEVVVVSLDPALPNPVSIFVREKIHSPKLNTTVFPIEKAEDFKTYVPEEAVKDIADEEPIVHENEELTGHESQTRPHESLEVLAEKEQEALDNLDEENLN